MKELLTIFVTFLKIGAFTFCGGYAMIPLIQHEAVEKHHWVTDGDILDIVAIAESTPGPIAINAATFVGYRTAGVLGSALATLMTILPAFLIISPHISQLTACSGKSPVCLKFMGLTLKVSSP